jgi:hypothetical protein
MVKALRDGGIDTAHGFGESLPCRACITRLNCGTYALHTGTHGGADVPVARGAFDRLAGSLLC